MPTQNLWCALTSNKVFAVRGTNVNILTISTWRGRERREVCMWTQETRNYRMVNIYF